MTNWYPVNGSSRGAAASKGIFKCKIQVLASQPAPAFSTKPVYISVPENTTKTKQAIQGQGILALIVFHAIFRTSVTEPQREVIIAENCHNMDIVQKLLLHYQM